MRNVIVCIDGSSSANYAFRWASENFLRSDDHVILLHATKDFRSLDVVEGSGSSGSGRKGELPSEVIHAYEQKVEEQARLLTAQYTNQLLAGNIKHEAAIVKGDPRTIILDYVEKYQPAAVIMGSRGLGMLKRSFLGSVSDFVMHNSPSPTIVIREQPEAGKK